MIISHAYQFIFIKVNKTATSSIEVALAPLLGPLDTCTRVNPGGINYFSGKNVVPGAFNHMNPNQIIRIFGSEAWNNSLRAASVRNPWDLCATIYEWRKVKNDKRAVGVEFGTWLEKCHARETYANADILTSIFTSDGIPDYFNVPKDTHLEKPITNFHIRFEHLQEDFSSFCKLVKLPIVPDLPFLASSGRTRHYREYYDQKSKESVLRHYRNVIDFFDYSF